MTALANPNAATSLHGLPPGPRGALRQTVRYALDPLGCYADCVRRYGNVFTVPTVLGPVVVCCAPEALRDFFSADPDTMGRWSTDSIAALVGTSSLFTTAGAGHRRNRRLIAPAFHPARIRAYGVVVKAATSEALSRWRDGQPLCIKAASSSIALDIVVSAVFGLARREMLRELRQAVLEASSAFGPLLMLFPRLRRAFGGIGPYARFLRHRARLYGMIAGEIDARRRSSHRGDDLLSQLLIAQADNASDLTDAAIRDHLLTMIVAGHETTGVALTWALYCLDRHPAAAQRLRAEVDALGADPDAESFAQCVYLDAVCRETLRLYPIVAEVIRVPREPRDIAGVHLPAQTPVAACIAAVHMDPRVYAEPNLFRPERFTGRRFAAYEFAPFGGGSRRCPGAELALLEMKVVLATMVRQFSMRPRVRRTLRPVLRNLAIAPPGRVVWVAERRA